MTARQFFFGAWHPIQVSQDMLRANNGFSKTWRLRAFAREIPDPKLIGYCRSHK